MADYSLFVCEPFDDEFPACFDSYEEALEFQSEYGGSISVGNLLDIEEDEESDGLAVYEEAIEYYKRKYCDDYDDD